MTSSPAPTAFGAPQKFANWRDGQDVLFWDILDSKHRFSIHNAPVGSGKSLAYMTAALAKGKRVAVLTESKALQDQLADDFGAVLFDMRGLANYTCRALAEGGEFEQIWSRKWGRPTCNIGPCQSGLQCGLKDSGCEYFDAYAQARRAQIVSTNYAYWIAIHRYGQGLGEFDWLILDECHAAASQLAKALSVEFDEKDYKELRSRPPKDATKLQNWVMWGREQLRRVQGRLEFFARGDQIGRQAGPDGVVTFVHDTDLPDAEELRFWKNLEGKCRTLSEATEDWVLERDDATGNMRLAPIWVSSYAESHLFLHTKRVIMTSGTVVPKVRELLSIPDSQHEFKVYPSTFPVERRPIFWIPTLKLSHRTTPEELRTWVVRIDQIIRRRMDRKGIIHSVCVEPKTKVLTTDLRWVRADSIQQADRLLGFDEFPSTGRGGCRKWRVSQVLDRAILRMPSVRVTLQDGTSIVCSRDHLWLTQTEFGGTRWVRSCRLMAGSRAASHIMRVLNVWETGTDWRDGYLAAAYEGEGHLYQKKYVTYAGGGRSLSVGFSQNPNCMLDRVKGLLDAAGYRYVQYGQRDRSIRRLTIAGKAEVLRFLGQIRPERLQRKLDLNDLGKMACIERVRVVRVEDVGIQTVVFIKTDTATFVAEGLASHNSFDRQEFFLAHTRFRSVMYANTRGGKNTRDVVKAFREAKAPAILVSPSVGTGFDFPYELARFQIIGKVPFKDPRGAIIRAQAEQDPDYLNYLTAQDLDQYYGRPNRAPDDYAETFFVDDWVESFVRRYRHFFSDHFLEAFQRVDDISNPPDLEGIGVC